jgi:hypothetical protein
MTEDEKKFMLNQTASDRRFLLEKMPVAIESAQKEGRQARAAALQAEYEFMMSIERGEIGSDANLNSPK